MRNRILYHKNEIQEVNHPERNTMQLVLPKAFRKQVFQGCHVDLGHLRMVWTIDLLRDHFYWPGTIDNMTRHIRQCERCLKFKALPEKAPMKTQMQHDPMEFTWYAQAIVTSSQTSKMYSPKLMGQIHCPLWAS